MIYFKIIIKLILAIINIILWIPIFGLMMIVIYTLHKIESVCKNKARENRV
jgi:hypothetical protein